MSDDSGRQAGVQTQLVSVIAAELSRQDPRAIDLSDGAMTRLQLFDLIDVGELALAIRAHFAENENAEIDNH